MSPQLRANMKVETARAALWQASARLTPQREAVLRALLQDPERHQSAEELLQAARRLLPEIGLATVYRTLELFAKVGMVRRLDTTEGQARFEFNVDGAEHYHHHVICLRCGQIAEFNEDLLDQIEERVSRRTGYRILDHCLQLYGHCPQCQVELPEESPGT